MQTELLHVAGSSATGSFAGTSEAAGPSPTAGPAMRVRPSGEGPGRTSANFTSGLGVPTLDGLGPVGGADHTPEEWLDTSSVPARIALLAALIERLGRRR